MLITRKSSISFVFLSILTLACSRPSASQIHDDVRASLEANKNAKTLTEWDSSADNNEAIFRRWQDSHAEPEAVCKAFAGKTGRELALFEEEINSEKYLYLTAPCHQELLNKIEAYWAEERKKLVAHTQEEAPPAPPPVPPPTEPGAPAPTPAPTPMPVYKFPTNRQTRDVSKGYKTATGNLAPKEVILTFDDGPHSIHTDKILAALGAVNAKAVFFSMGINVKKRAAILTRVGKAGHSIGSHSVDHKCLPASPVCEKNNGKMLTSNEAIEEIKGGHQAVKDAIGWVDPFFRFPYGESSPELSGYLKDHSVGEFYWTIDSEDWKNHTPLEMLNITLAEVERRRGGIILMHDIQRKTAEVLPELLVQLYFKGYSVVQLRSSNPAWDRRHSKLVK